MRLQATQADLRRIAKQDEEDIAELKYRQALSYEKGNEGAVRYYGRGIMRLVIHRAAVLTGVKEVRLKND